VRVPSSSNHDNSPQSPTPPVSGRGFLEPSASSPFASTWYAFRNSGRLPEFRRVAPISPPSSLPAFALNQGSFPPSALPNFVSNTSLSATPPRPLCPSRAYGWSCARPRDGVSRVACAFLVYMLSPLPRRSDWASCFAHPSQPCQPSPVWQPGRPAHRPFRGLLGVYSRYGLHTRAVTVFRDTLIRRLQPFRFLHSCSGCFRLEPWPGGAGTHWKSAALSRRTPIPVIRRGQHYKREAPRLSQGFAGLPHDCGLIWSRQGDVCRGIVTGVGVER